MSYARWATKGEVLENTTRITRDSEVKKSGVTVMYDDEAIYVNDQEVHSISDMLSVINDLTNKSQCVLPRYL